MKKILILFFAAVFVFLSLPLGVFSAAEETEAPAVDLYTELSKLFDKDSGWQFNREDYPADKEGLPQILMINEQGDHGKDDYRLYLYVYNPSQIEFECGKQDRVQVAVSWNVNGSAIDGKSFDKLRLSYVSNTEDRLFYKFEIINSETREGDYFKEVLQSSIRNIEISSIELQTKGAMNATDYLQDLLFRIKGTEASTKTIIKSDRLSKSVELDVHYTWWRNGGSAENYHQWQVNTIYFSVPKEYEVYGDLNRLRYEAYEYKTAPVLLTNSSGAYNAFYPHRASLYIDEGDEIEYYFAFPSGVPNLFCLNHYWRPLFGECSCENTFRSLGAVIKVDDISNSTVFSASSEEFLKQIFAKDTGNNRTTPQGYDAYFFQYDIESEEFVVDSGCVPGYHQVDVFYDDASEFSNYTESNSWWDRFCEHPESIFSSEQIGKHFKIDHPIRKVGLQELKGLSDEQIRDTYFVQSAADLKSYIAAEEEKGNVVYVVNFAIRDYFSSPVIPAMGGDGMLPDGHGILCIETVFLDFDVIELEFKKDDVKTVVAVSADPKDLVADVESAPDYSGGIDDKFEEFLKRLKRILMLFGLFIVVVVILVLFWNPIKDLINWLWDLITSPFRKKKTSYKKRKNYRRRRK